MQDIDGFHAAYGLLAARQDEGKRRGPVLQRGSAPNLSFDPALWDMFRSGHHHYSMCRARCKRSGHPMANTAMDAARWAGKLLDQFESMRST